MAAPAQGDILYRNASDWVRLPAGTSGKFLKTQGASANPTWDTVTGGGGGGVISASGFYLDDGSQKYAPVFAVTPPIDANYAWINQGGASVDTTGGGVYLLVPVGDASQWRIRKKAAPVSTPYTITIAVLLGPMVQNNDMFAALFRQSSDGKLVVLSLQYVGGVIKLAVHKYSSPSAFSATYTELTVGTPGPLWFFQLSDNGTNRICRYSFDGLHWLQLHSIGRTDYLTADEVGFGINMNTAASAKDYGATILSWKET